MSWVSQMMKQGRESSAEVARRLDSWVNTLSGVGTARDKTTYMQPGVVSVLSPMDLENLYATDDIAVRIVRAIVDECYREEWMILQDSDEAADGMDPGERNDEEESGEQQRLKARMKELEAWRKLKESRIWGRLYGKAALLLGAVHDHQGRAHDRLVRGSLGVIRRASSAYPASVGTSTRGDSSGPVRGRTSPRSRIDMHVAPLT